MYVHRPTVERMNDYAPQHSRVFKEMILVTSPDKPFTYTAKSTPRRQAIINEYEPEIEAIYAAAAESTQAEDLTPPVHWDEAETKEFVSTIVRRVVKAKLGDDDDMFQKGCDRCVRSHFFPTFALIVCNGQFASNLDPQLYLALIAREHES